jgi:Protein of unknown function (DUF5818)
MRKLSLSVCLVFAFFVASAVAQTTPGGGQGTQSSSPSMSQPAQQQPGGMNQPDNTTPTAQTDQNTANQNEKGGEHKLKGCVQSQGGQYALETKKGKTVALAGQDVSAHVGHEVSVKGTWESGMSAASSSNTGSSGKTFNVTEVKMVSDTCKGHSGSMDHSSGSNSGSSSPNTGNSTSQPPQ